MNKCGDCIRFEKCKPYTTEDETFPEVGGCANFERIMPNTFGERLRLARKNKWMKQCALAKMIGITQTHLSLIERGKIKPTVTTLEWICKALDVSATELLGY